VSELVHAFEVNGTEARILGMLKTTQNQALANAFATGCGKPALSGRKDSG
jgi:hypothetical protein